MKAWRLQGELLPASQKEPEGWSAAYKFTVLHEIAGLNDTELGAYCRERGLFPEQVSRWRQAATDANAAPVLTMAEQKELQRKDKALAEAAALLSLRKKWEALCSEDSED
jgi:hypothetical protein